MRRNLGAILTLTLITWLAPTPVGADAVLVVASPADQAIAGGEVSEVQFVFNELVTDGDITVTGPDGQVPLIAQTRSGQVLSARFEPLDSEGRYTATYSLISADTDPVSGSVSFLYRADGPALLPVVVPAIQSGPSPLLVGAGTIGVAFVLLLGGQVYLRTRRVQLLGGSDGVPSER